MKKNLSTDLIYCACCLFTPLMASCLRSLFIPWSRECGYITSDIVMIILLHSILTALVLWIYAGLYDKWTNYGGTFFQPLPAGILLQILCYGIWPWHFEIFFYCLFFYYKIWPIILSFFAPPLLIGGAVILLSLPWLVYQKIRKLPKSVEI